MATDIILPKLKVHFKKSYVLCLLPVLLLFKHFKEEKVVLIWRRIQGMITGEEATIPTVPKDAILFLHRWVYVLVNQLLITSKISAIRYDKAEGEESRLLLRPFNFPYYI